MRDQCEAAAAFLSSGDVIADRRYLYALALAARGERDGAVDLLAQTLTLAPQFAAAWFALGDLREAAGERDAAVVAFANACAADPEDRAGAALRLARLGADGGATSAQSGMPGMPPAYVRTLFDQYAPRFDAALREGLAYRAPELLRDAVARACAAIARAPRFSSVLDLGCGTGLAGAALRAFAAHLAGVDLSPGMIAQAAAKGVYDRLETGDLLACLAAEAGQGRRHDLIVAADAFPYLADLAPAINAAGRALTPAGLLAFTVETHAGDGVTLNEKLRYAHGAVHVRAALASAGLVPLDIAEAATRTEAGAPVAGLVVVAGAAGHDNRGPRR